LTKQMRRSLAYCWPKAESVLYDEPKRLVQQGLASTRLELEPLLRVLYADQAGITDLLRAIATARAWVSSETERGLAQLVGYRADGGPFPDRLHIIILFADLCARLFEAIEAWAADAQTEVQSWSSTRALGGTPGTSQRLDDIIDRAHQLLARSAAAGTSMAA
jgi:PadR family transcriptional regulator AphA